MKTYLLNIISVLTAFCISSGVIRAYAPEEAVAAFVHSPSVDSAKVAVMVRDLGSGNVVASYNEDVPLVPASIQKAVTTATLLRTAGKDWAYHTKAYVDGDVERGVLEGNVVVVGSGDPTLNSSKLPLTPDFVADVASALRTKGIDSIAGKIRVDGSVFKGGGAAVMGFGRPPACLRHRMPWVQFRTTLPESRRCPTRPPSSCRSLRPLWPVWAYA